MVQEKISARELYMSLDECALAIMQQVQLLTETELNAIPFEGSWSAGQLAEHVTRSNTGIARALNIEGKPANRNADAREAELREMFLDFTIKFKSPEFILPTKSHYEKEVVTGDIENSVSLLKEVAKHTKLDESIKHPAFGEITKLELLYFVKFHMQRHLWQLKKIVNAVIKT